MHFLDAVEVLPDETTQTLKEKVFTKMKDYYVANSE
jgi:hypothetical protein